MNATRVRPLVVLVALVAVVVVVAGCGIDTQSKAQRVSDDDVPFGLLATKAEGADPATTGRPVVVYLFGSGDRLAPVERRVPRGAKLAAVTRVLGAGPTKNELAVGLSSPLPPRQVKAATASRGIAQVDLEASFADLPSQDQNVAIAQLVFTLTGQPGIGRVSFTLDGQPVEVPRGDGALTTDPLVREDFSTFAPAP
jgi:spore germination protein GerM